MNNAFPVNDDDLLTTVRRLWPQLANCRLCPRECGANRLAGDRGFCGAGLLPEVASATVHQGEEPPISGWRGSGTVFFSHCSLRCLFCQNWPISQKHVGRVLTVAELAEKMLALQRRGVHNINLVNPTHYWPQIAAAVYLARKGGLRLPVLANTSGYENTSTLQQLGEVVQIWLPDVKYSSGKLAEQYSGAKDLPKTTWRALRWMVEHAGPLVVGSDGLAKSGVLIRHLVLPDNSSDTRMVLHGIKRRFDRTIPVSLLTQYFPAHRAHDQQLLARPLTNTEKESAMRMIRRLELTGGWRQADAGNETNC